MICKKKNNKEITVQSESIHHAHFDITISFDAQRKPFSTSFEGKDFQACPIYEQFLNGP